MNQKQQEPGLCIACLSIDLTYTDLCSAMHVMAVMAVMASDQQFVLQGGGLVPVWLH